MSVPANLDRDGLPENAVEVVAKALCRDGSDDGKCACDYGNECVAEEQWGSDALQAVAALRVGIREINGRRAKQ